MSNDAKQSGDSSVKSPAEGPVGSIPAIGSILFFHNCSRHSALLPMGSVAANR